MSLSLKGIPEGHQFHFDLVNVLNTLLNVWLNECPLIVEIVTSLLSRYWEFAPQLLLDCASNPQEFGSRVATLIIHTKQWYVDEEKRTSQDPDPSQPPRPLQPYPPHQLPSWLETQVVDFLPSLNPRHELAFRQLVASSQFVEGEFKFNNLVSLIRDFFRISATDTPLTFILVRSHWSDRDQGASSLPFPSSNSHTFNFPRYELHHGWDRSHECLRRSWPVSLILPRWWSPRIDTRLTFPN